MNASFKTFSNVASRFSVQVFSAFLFGPLIGWLIAAVLPSRISSPFVSFLVTAIFGILGVFLWTGTYLINRDNRRLKACAYDLHSINHIYRDALSSSFSLGDGELGSPAIELLNFERVVLKSVCEKISNLFSNLVGRKCVATVKLVVSDDENSHFCFTWARSESNSYREEAPASQYSILTGKNTGFDRALDFQDDRPSHYFSPDLWIDNDYKNERVGWQRLYRSTIVVPIRHVIDRDNAEMDLIGFLCIDTKSANRLNDTYAVEYLAAFADQMYNFMSIIRSNFPQGGIEQSTAESSPQTTPSHDLATNLNYE